MMSHFILLLKGMCMGAADVVPGVSGGTMALILGIYERLINAIKSFDLPWIKSVVTFDIKTALARPHFSFLIPLMLGIFSAILFFTRVVPLPVLIKTHPQQVYGLFFGLILASILLLMRETKKQPLINYLFVFSGIALGLFVFTLVPANTPNHSGFIFLSGALAICAMILPGISGSFILLMLKKYAYILHAIGHFQFSVILPFALGAVTGLMLFSRLLSWLLKRFYHPTLLFIIGLLIASLWVIWPFQNRTYEQLNGKEYLIQSVPYFPGEFTDSVLHSLLLAITGFILVLLIEALARRSR